MTQLSKLLVSIVTPSLNQDRFIEQTILSVLNQTYSNIEYIIMDGGSKDNTLEIIKHYAKDSRIKWFSDKDEGQYDAVNKGFAFAKGEILGWINADDIYVDTAIEKVVHVFSENKGTEVVYGKLYSADERGIIKREMTAFPYSRKWLRRYCYINPSATFIKASLVHDEGLLIDNSIPNYGDWDWFLRMAEAGKRFYFLPEIIGHFRFHPSSKIKKMNEKEIHVERLMISRKHHIPLNYINFWQDFMILWVQRIAYFLHLVRKKDFGQIVNRFFEISKRLYRNLVRKLA